MGKEEITVDTTKSEENETDGRSTPKDIALSQNNELVMDIRK